MIESSVPFYWSSDVHMQSEENVKTSNYLQRLIGRIDSYIHDKEIKMFWVGAACAPLSFGAAYLCNILLTPSLITALLSGAAMSAVFFTMYSLIIVSALIIYVVFSSIFSSISTYLPDKITKSQFETAFQLLLDKNYSFVQEWINQNPEQDLEKVKIEIWKELQGGTCKGYSLVLMDLMCANACLSSRELLKKIDLEQVILRQMIHHIRVGLGKITFPTMNKFGRTHETSKRVAKMAREALRAEVKVQNSIGWKHEFGIANASDDSKKIEEQFLKLMKNGSFINTNQANLSGFIDVMNSVLDEQIPKEKENSSPKKSGNIFTFMEGLVDSFFNFTKKSNSKDKNNVQDIQLQQLQPPQPFSRDTIFAGDVIMASHSIFFQYSHGYFRFFDANAGFFETPNSSSFFEVLRRQIKTYKDADYITFNVYAIEPKPNK